MKKFLLAFLFGFVPLLSAIAIEPISVSFSKDTINTSGSIFVKITYNESSIVYVYFDLIKPDGKILKSEQTTYLYSSYNYETFNYTFDKYDVGGLYKISNISYYSLIDGDTTKTNITASFVVANTTPDIVPPAIKNFSASKNNAVPGDTIAIAFNAEDTLSGVFNFNMSIPGTTFTKSGNLFGAKSGKISCNYIVGQFEKSGAKNIKINLCDKKQNCKEYNNSNLNFNVNVTGTTPDTVAPVIESIYSNVDTDSIYLNIYAKDDVSGIEKFNCNLYKYSQQSKQLVLSPVLTKVNDSLYVSNISRVSPYIATGNYLVEATAIDKNSNSTKLEYTVTILNNNSDITAPVFTASMDKDTVFKDDELTLKIKMTDDKSGLKAIYYDLNCVGTSYYYGYQYSIFTTIVKDTTMLLKIRLPKFGTAGRWKIAEIQVTDNLNNSSSATSNLFFEYYPKATDNKPPVFEKFTFSSGVVNAGDTVFATVNAYDLESGIKSVNISTLGYSYTLPMVKEKTFQMAIPINKYASPEKRSGWQIKITDLAGNIYSAFNNAEFNVINNRNIDVLPPVLDSLTIFPTNARLTDTIKITAYAHDEISGIDTFGVALGFESIKNSMTINAKQKGNNKFEYLIKPGEALPGKYVLTSLNATDLAGNSVNNNAESAYDLGYSFEVSGTINNQEPNDDKVAPKVISIKVTPSKVKPGEKVEIEVKAYETSPLVEMYAVIQDNDEFNSSLYLHKVETTQVNDTFTCKAIYTIPEYTFNGVWSLDILQLSDKSTNYNVLYNAQPNIFEVVGSLDFPNRMPCWFVDNYTLAIKAGKVENYTIPYYWLTDPDDDELTCTPTLNGESLPSWISYNSKSKSFTLSPTNENAGDHVIYVTASDPEGLKDTLTLKVKVKSTVEIGSLQNEEFKIYPNPAKDYVSIQTSEKVNEVYIFDIIGKIRLQSTSYNGKIDVSALKRGIYVMQIITDKGTHTEKLIIK
jgi:hypothetical protein